jgi:predicted  nucleic acid-binding Zn-ribbon protein
MSLPLKLFQLQKIDSQIDQANSRVEEIEATLNDNSILNKGQNRVQEMNNDLNFLQKRQSRAEDDLQAHRLKLEQSESTLYGGKVTNPKELQDIHKEVASLKKYLITLEDRVLDAMLEVEELFAQYKKSKDDLEIIQSQISTRNATLTGEKNKILAEIERLNKERNVYSSSLPEEELKKYEHLRKIKRGVAVSQVIDNTCSTCGSTLSASLLQAANSMNKYAYCDTCGRILYGGK